MSEIIKYDGHPKNFSKFLERLYPAVGALSFVFGKLNDKRPIDLTAVVYMGEFLIRVPPLTLKTWKWSMKQLITDTESAHAVLDERKKRMLLELKKILGKDEAAWVAARHAVKEVILKYLSPDLSEIGEIETHDPFGASRLVWILCRNFKAQVLTIIPSLNRELLTTIENFSKMCTDISGVSTFFQQIYQLLKTGAAAKDSMLTETMICSEIVAKLNIDTRVPLNFLALNLTGVKISLHDLETKIKNQVSLIPAQANHVASNSPAEQETVPSTSFFAQSRQKKYFPATAFYGAQSNRFQRSKRNFDAKIDRSHSPLEKKTNSLRRGPRIPSSVWATWSMDKRRKWIELQNEVKRMAGQKFDNRVAKQTGDREEMDFFANLDSDGFGSVACFAEVHHVTSQIEETQPMIESMTADDIEDSEGPTPLIEETQLQATTALTPADESMTAVNIEDSKGRTPLIEESQLHAMTALTPADEIEPVFRAIDSGASSHYNEDASNFKSLKPCKVPISTAKKGEVIYSEGIGEVPLTARNKTGDLVTILLKNVLYVPTAGRSLISCSALRADGYQTIFPQPDRG